MSARRRLENHSLYTGALTDSSRTLTPSARDVGRPERTNSSRPGSRMTDTGWLGDMLYRGGIAGTSSMPKLPR
jgi:hypothetical protein